MPEAKKAMLTGRNILAAPWLPWLPLIVGLAALYVPTLYRLLSGIWGSQEHMHGPVVLTIGLWLFYRNWDAMEKAAQGDAHRRSSPWGWVVFGKGLLLYAIGRSQDVLMFETGSVIALLAGMVWLRYGATALRVQWFALFFLFFMIPLPGVIVDAFTMPMKMAVSYVAEHLLYAVGYPIARSGVILQVGQYMLLVADACAGLHTLLTLESLGLLYLNLVRRDSLFRNVTLAILIVPISFAANVIRVTTLCLITYHFGDEAGQGFLHGFAGMVLFLSALLLIVGIDSAVQAIEAWEPVRGWLARRARVDA
ncbi:exosortase B [Candidatus Symbiobacter mobilis]|uniref:Exosortase B n=1 Tax=Candidatus Symbiobacter mobilis CR TaxID=946483 RepID=U5N7U4_9BURK|nr:exosortase B [Candidatus Symbiobacter mobilis]AGX87457.1 hypothetical protein Cenrod_1370 [Candidatus Symbiobacter mobilis CR]